MNHARLRLRQHERAGLSPAREQARFLFERRIKFGAGVNQPAQSRLRRATDQTRGPRSSASADLTLFDQHHVAAALFGEMICEAATDDAAANNEDAGLFGKRMAHSFSKESKLFFLNERKGQGFETP